MDSTADNTKTAPHTRTHVALEHVLRFLAHGKTVGIPVDGLLAFYGIDLRRDTRKPGYVPGHIWEMIAILGVQWCDRLGDPLAGMSAAHGLGNSFLGLWGFIAEKSETLGKALEVAATYRKLHGDTLHAKGRHRPGYLDIVLTPRFRATEACDHAADFYLILLDRFVKHCTGEAEGVVESVHFRHGAPPTPELLARYRSAFQCPLHFNAEENLLRIHASALGMPLVTADTLLQASLEQRAREQLANYDRMTDDITALARRHLRTLIADGRASKESLAEMLGMNPRTLLRKLQAAGTTYRALSHEVRLEQARQYLAQPLMPLAFVSTHLGFQDPQSFSRWFSEQTGEAPSVYRGRHLSAPLAD